jgi:HEAT repeat protein
MDLINNYAIRDLLGVMDGPSAAVRAGALRALVQLPLKDGAWREVARRLVRMLDQTAEGEDFSHQTLEGVPFREVIDAAVHVPFTSVRQRLYAFLKAEDESLRSAAAFALAGAWDGQAIPTLIEVLQSNRPKLSFVQRMVGVLKRDAAGSSAELDYRRLSAARLLARLDVLGAVNDVMALYRQESAGEVRFWLAVALAGAGELAPLKRVLNVLKNEKPSMDDFYGPPDLLSNELQERRAFKGDLAALKALLVEAAKDDARGIASDLLAGLQPSPPVSLPPSGGDPAQATALARQLIDHPPYDETGMIPYENIEKLRPLDPVLASDLVSAMFRALAFSGQPQVSMRFDNDLVRLVYRFDQPLRPNITVLFICYQQVYQTNHPLAWQIAWAVSRAGAQEMVNELTQRLWKADEAERLAVVQLIEDAARYLRQVYSPMFGGGSSPPDGLPVELKDDAAGEDDQKGPITKGESEPNGSRDDSAGEDGQTKEVDHGQHAMRGKRQKLPERVVNTGFAPQAQPDALIEPVMPLQTGAAYFFWFDIGEPVKGSIESTLGDVPAVPAETALTVALFGFQDGLLLTPGADTGEMYLHASGLVSALRQPLGDQAPASSQRNTRLFFPVRTPDAPGTYSLRCNIYWGQVLLQSRLVTAQTAAQPSPAAGAQPALISTLDYTLTNQLSAAHLLQLKPDAAETARVSLLLNDNQDGTHSFHFFYKVGEEIIKNDDVRFGEGELSGMINQARQKLRKVTWGSEDEWKEGTPYRYQTRKVDLDMLTADLITLAKWGREFYVQVGGRLGEMQVRKLQDVMVTPAYIEIAMKESPSYILPAAMIYDYPLDTFGAQYSLCPEFVRGLGSGQALENTLCFQGQCPSRGQNTVVCPSGFWGFRHYLGMPPSVKLAPPVPATIDYQGQLHMVMGESADLELLTAHEQALNHLDAARMAVQPAQNRADIFQALQQSPHLVYFYCHGGLDHDAPYLQVGRPPSPEMILPSNMVEYVYWQNPRPLVFLNGCHTTAVDPLKALQFISPLVEECQCAGVIGTEITIFEPLATVFAIEFYQRLLRGETVAKALRGARLKVLAEGNPLGLVYIPFVLSTLTLRDVTV